MTNLKTIILLGFLWFSCSCEQPKNRVKSESRNSVPKPEGYRKDTLIKSSNVTDTGRWNFQKYLDDPTTPQLAKDIYYGSWKLKDDEPLIFLEKLNSKDKQARPFY